jgi:hypothetical protein
MKPAKPRVKAYKSTRFGVGMQPGNVEWELNPLRLRAERREEDRQWASSRRVSWQE